MEFEFGDEPAEVVSYVREVPGYGELLPVDVWKGYVEDGNFADGDGYCYACKNNKLTNRVYLPSEMSELPPDATHVLWLNI